MRNKATIKNLIAVCSAEVTKYNKIRSGIIKGSIKVDTKTPPESAYWILWSNNIIKSNLSQIKTLKDKLHGL